MLLFVFGVALTCGCLYVCGVCLLWLFCVVVSVYVDVYV